MLTIVVLLVAYLLLLSLLVLLQDYRRRTNVALVSFNILLVVWFVVVMLLQTSFGESLYFARLVFVIGLWAAGVLAWFTYELISEEHPMPLARKVMQNGVAIYIVVSIIIMTSPLIISGLELHPGKVPIPLYGSGYMLYVLIIGFTINSIVTWLFTGYKAAVGETRRQLRTVTITLSVAVFTAFMTNIIIPLVIDNTQSALLLPVTVVIVICGLSYAIARDGLLDIKAATVRSLVYALSTLTMAGIYFSLAYIASITIFKNQMNGASMNPVNVVLALVLAFVFQPIKHFFDRVTDKIFYRNQYDSNAFIAQLGDILTRAVDLSELLEQTNGVIATTLKASTNLFVVHRDKVADEAVGSLVPEFNQLEYKEIAQTVTALPNRVSVVSRLAPTDTATSRLQTLLADKHVALIVPLRSADQAMGYILLGEQMSGGYTKQDIDILDTIRGELVIAIQNVRSVQEVLDLNTNLEQKVGDATKELRSSNKRLLELDAMKDEFVSMASHQLRTPLTSVKGYISMVLEGDAGKITKAQRQLLQEAFTSSERMVHLISDFLNVSRLQTGKFIVDRKAADLAEITAQEVANISQIAVSHQVRVTYKKPELFPLLYIDEGKVRQVIMNFIDNAIYYSPDSASIKVTLSIEDGDAVLRVIDKGMGVPEEAKQKLFTKFFRAENARKQRPDGTGVGLFLAKKVIDGHGGSLVFESTLGQGSTFGFRLPIKKLSIPPPVDGQTIVG